MRNKTIAKPFETQRDELPAVSQSDGAHVLYRSDSTLVFRAPGKSGKMVVYKQPRGPSALARLNHERRILEKLEGIHGVPRLAEGTERDALALQDDEGLPLARLLANGAYSLEEVLELAIRLTSIVAAIHRAGVLHRDINPANILVAGDERNLILIDYHLATTPAEARPAFLGRNGMAGTLAYIAPEQTGRTGKSVDRRADLYALGAVLYELATGRRPFVEDDPLALVHAHLARIAPAPAELDHDIPAVFSEVIMRLLDKEPDRRYQSGEGLHYDLVRLQGMLEGGRTPEFDLGARDYPLRLQAPARLIERDAETTTLWKTLADAIAGRRTGVLIEGAPGVGKSALIDQLRPVVSSKSGKFVKGKFDQFRADGAAETILNTLAGLARLLLAESESELAKYRDRIALALDRRSGLLAATRPEFAALLGPASQEASSDPLVAEVELRMTAVEFVRAVASPQHPVVLVLDDLQWSDANSLRFIDAVLTDGKLPGLLVVGAYRASEVGPAHPLSAMLERWTRLGVAPPIVHLGNLPATGVGTLLEAMLHLEPPAAAGLADAIATQTSGNPYDTVELVNALRRDGLVTMGDAGWEWDDCTIRRYVGQSAVSQLLTTRIQRLPQKAHELLEIVACLGSEVPATLLQVAAAVSAQVLDELLEPALADGLLTFGQRRETKAQSQHDRDVRFPHDRVRQIAYDGMEATRRSHMHVTVARRLAASGTFKSWASEQYLAAVSEIEDSRERREVVALFRQAAARARLSTAYGLLERLATTALELLLPIATGDDATMIATLRREQHSALYSLGRCDEADRAYASLAEECDDITILAEATSAQVTSLYNRAQTRQAVQLGRDMLRRLGLEQPEDVAADTASWVGGLRSWIDDKNSARELRDSAENVDPRDRATAILMYRMLAPAIVCDPDAVAWLVMESQRLWKEHGPHASFVANLSFAPLVTVSLRDDYRTGYDCAKHALRAGEARGYEPETSWARSGLAMFGQHWFEPLEAVAEQAHIAHDGLVQGGDTQSACFTYYTSLAVTFDCAPALDRCWAELERASAFAARTSNDFAKAGFERYAELFAGLCGRADWRALTQRELSASLAENPARSAAFHIACAVLSVVFGDTASLLRHTTAAKPLLAYIPGSYRSSLVHFLHALALSDAARELEQAARGEALAQLDWCVEWLARRAADAPMNFTHMRLLIEAERAWTGGNLWEAARAYDAALQDVRARKRPWHHALTLERAALFYRSNGMQSTGRDVLREARSVYDNWGATAKVRALDVADPSLQRDPSLAARHTGQSTTVSSDAVDLLAILGASQALSSETNLERLRTRVIETLAAISGATAVTLVLNYDEPLGWCLLAETRSVSAPIPVNEAAERGLVSSSAFRYAHRTQETLLVEDALRDERFSGDPYFAGLRCCSLLVLPICSHGVVRAVLILENRLSGNAFSADRLDAVNLIAGQLAVSLDNALLYESLERKVAERTEALASANHLLETLSATDSLTNLANRRRFDEVLQTEWDRALRTKAHLALAMIDIDYFKRYNDRYGHVAGDKCLQRVAHAIRDCVRAGMDLPARFGGEEFVVVLPVTDELGAWQTGERIRDAVAALRLPHETSEFGIVTISVGVHAVVAAHDHDCAELLAKADAELYRAKENGRNRCLRGITGRVPDSRLVASAASSRGSRRASDPSR